MSAIFIQLTKNFNGTAGCVALLKKDLLIKIWGFSDKINTHTLETHIYRLKKKLNKIDKNLSLSLRNKNGLYYLNYNS